MDVSSGSSPAVCSSRVEDDELFFVFFFAAIATPSRPPDDEDVDDVVPKGEGTPFARLFPATTPGTKKGVFVVVVVVVVPIIFFPSVVFRVPVVLESQVAVEWGVFVFGKSGSFYPFFLFFSKNSKP